MENTSNYNHTFPFTTFGSKSPSLRYGVKGIDYKTKPEWCYCEEPIEAHIRPPCIQCGRKSVEFYLSDRRPTSTSLRVQCLDEDGMVTHNDVTHNIQLISLESFQLKSCCAVFDDMVLITPGRERDVIIACSLTCASLYISSLANLDSDKAAFELENERLQLLSNHSLLNSETIVSVARFQAKLDSFSHHPRANDQFDTSSKREELNPLLLQESLYESLSDDDLMNLYEAKLLFFNERKKEKDENNLVDIAPSFPKHTPFYGPSEDFAFDVEKVESDDFMTALLERVDKARKKRDAHVSQLFAQNQAFVGWFGDIEERVGGRGASFEPHISSKDEGMEPENDDETRKISLSSRISSLSTNLNISHTMPPLSPDLPIDISELEAHCKSNNKGKKKQKESVESQPLGRVTTEAIRMAQYPLSSFSSRLFTVGGMNESQTHFTHIKVNKKTDYDVFETQKTEIDTNRKKDTKENNTTNATDTCIIVKPDIDFSSNLSTIIRERSFTKDVGATQDLELYDQFGIFQDPFLGSDLDDDSESEESENEAVVEDCAVNTQRSKITSSVDNHKAEEVSTLPSVVDLYQVLYGNIQKPPREQIEVADDLERAYHTQRQQELDAFDIRVGGKETFSAFRSQINDLSSKTSDKMSSEISLHHPDLFNGQGVSFFYPEEEAQFQEQFGDESVNDASKRVLNSTQEIQKPLHVQKMPLERLFDDSKSTRGVFGGAREKDILHLHAILGSGYGDEEDEDEDGNDSIDGKLDFKEEVITTDIAHFGKVERDQYIQKSHPNMSFIPPKSAAWALMPSKSSVSSSQHLFSPAHRGPDIYADLEEHNSSPQTHTFNNDYNHFMYNQRDYNHAFDNDFYDHNNTRYEPTDLEYEEDFEHDELQQALSNFTF